MSRLQQLGQSIEHASSTLASCDNMIRRLQATHRPVAREEAAASAFPRATYLRESRPANDPKVHIDSRPTFIQEESVAALSDFTDSESVDNTNHKVVQLLNATTSQYQEAQNFIRHLQAENASLSSELQSARLKLADQSKEQLVSQESLRSTLKRVESLEQDLSSERRRTITFQNLEFELAAQKTANTQLQAELQASRDQSSSMQLQLAAHERQRDEWANMRSDFQVQIKQLEAINKQRQDDIDTLKRESSSAEDTYRRQLHFIQETQSRFIGFPMPAYSIDRPDRQMMGDLIAEQQRASSLQRQSEQLQSQNVQLQATVKSLQDEVSSTQRKLAKAKSKAEHLSEDVTEREESLRSQMQHLDSTWSQKTLTLEADLEAARNRIASLDLELQSATSPSKLNGLRESEVSALCADLEALCEELVASLPASAGSYVPSAPADLRVRLNHYLSFIQTKVRLLVRERNKLRESIKAADIDRGYLASELENKNEQVRRLTALHQEERAALLQQVQQAQTRARLVDLITGCFSHLVTAIACAGTFFAPKSRLNCWAKSLCAWLRRASSLFQPHLPTRVYKRSLPNNQPTRVAAGELNLMMRLTS
eukprot:m.106175 g.106175  ORF g.106175 m.106175 type:complete len:598 (+) comp51674_c0_seq1:18-1811(+)